MASATDIKNKIVTVLEGVSSIKNVFGYATSNFNGNYPVANVTLLDGEGEIRSNVHNLYFYRFKIEVFVMFGEVGFNPEEAEGVAVSILDDIMTAFNTKITLDGIVEYCMPVSWNTDYVDRENDVRVLSLTLEAKKLESVSV